MAMQAMDRVRAMIEQVYGAGKMELIPQLVSDDFVQHDPMSGDIDRKQLENEVRMWRAAFPDMRMEVMDIMESGDMVCTRWRATGTHKGELAGIPATNKKIVVEGMSISRSRAGKTAELWVQYDLFGMLRQLGVAPEMGKPGAAPRPDGGRITAR